MRVLIAASSKYGATREIAERIADTIAAEGLATSVIEPGPASGIGAFDAAILGSAVYMGHWMKPMREFVERHAEALAQRPAWLFSSGPVGDPPKPAEEDVDVSDIEALVHPRGHRVFTGRLARKDMGFADRAIATALRAPDGDFRDWAAIEVWAREIAAALRRSS